MTAKRPPHKPPARGTPLPDDFVFGMSAIRKPQEYPPGFVPQGPDPPRRRTL